MDWLRFVRPRGGTEAGAAEAGVAACPPCVTDDDCGGGVCAQVGGDSYCAPTCPSGNECTEDRACSTVTTVNGPIARS